MRKLLIPIAALSSLFFSCEDNTTDPADFEATELTVADLRSNPGFSDFLITYNDYTPDNTLVQQISENFDEGSETIAIFVKPSCSCTNTQETLPHFIKALDEAGVGSENIKVFSMREENNLHPYSESLSIRKLPEFHVIRDGEFVYSIVDSMEAGGGMPIEFYAAESLK
jgi:hypothetical protein